MAWNIQYSLSWSDCSLSVGVDRSVKIAVHLSVLLLVCVSDRLDVGDCVHEIVRL